MYPLFSVSLGQYRQRNFYLFDVKSFLEFYLGTFCKLEILNKFPFARYALTYGQRLEMCTCILQLKRHCFTLKGGGGASKGFLSWGKVFFQTEIHLLFSQLISCIPNTNWTTVSSIGLDDAQPVPGEVYLHMIVNINILFITQDSVTYGQCPEKCICKWKGGKETVQCVNATLTKWDNFSLYIGRVLILFSV